MLLEELGIEKVINAWGTVTVLGGTTMTDDVIEAMREASTIYVDMMELHKKAGDLIARLIGVEATCVTSGATAGLILATAACITGGDRQKILDLPKADVRRNKVVVQRLQRNAFVNVLRTSGAEIAEIGSEKETTPRDLESVLNESIAAVMYFVFDPQPGVLSFQEVVRIAHGKGVPVIVDAAAELPPSENLTKFTNMGADVVVFSGGKDIGGPNDTGLVIGRRDLIETCMKLQFYEDVQGKTVALLGRSMKVSKEDIFALTRAIQSYLQKDHVEQMRIWEEKTDYMVSKLSKSGLPKVRKIIPGSGHGPRPLVIPTVSIDFNETSSGMNADEMSQKLRAGDPPIYVYTKDNALYLNPQCLQDNEEKVVVSRLVELYKTD